MDNDPITVRAFYDEFMVSRMLSYRRHGNARIEKAIERILPFVGRADHVLDSEGTHEGLRRSARRLAEERYDRRVIGREINRILNELAGGADRSRNRCSQPALRPS
jgi:hypothetical protein